MQYSEYIAREPPESERKPRSIRDESPKLKKRRRSYLDDEHHEYEGNKRRKLDHTEVEISERPGLPGNRLESAGDSSPTGVSRDRNFFDLKGRSDWESNDYSDVFFFEGANDDDWPSPPFNHIYRKKNKLDDFFDPETPKTLEDEEDILLDGFGFDGGSPITPRVKQNQLIDEVHLLDEEEELDEDEQTTEDEDMYSDRTLRLDLSDDEEDEVQDKVFVRRRLNFNKKKHRRPPPIKIERSRRRRRRKIVIIPPPDISFNDSETNTPTQSARQKRIQINSPFYLHTPSKKYESMIMTNENHRKKIRIGEEYQAVIPHFEILNSNKRRRKRDRSLELLKEEKRKLSLQALSTTSTPQKENNGVQQVRKKKKRKKKRRVRGGELYFNGSEVCGTQLKEEEVDHFLRVSKNYLTNSAAPLGDLVDGEKPRVSYTEILVDVLRNNNFDVKKSLMFVQKNLENMKKQKTMEVQEIRKYCNEELWW